MNIFLDVLQDTVSDSLHMLPFLFAAFLLIETLEHYSTTFINQALIKINKAGPLVGALRYVCESVFQRCRIPGYDACCLSGDFR